MTAPRRCLVVHAHPNPESFNTAVRDRAVETLETAGHTVDLIDLYAIGYRPCMSEREHLDYYTDGTAHPDPVVANHIERLLAAEALIFIYPTWWSGLPAILKGWLDRTLLPEVAFTLEPGPDHRAVVSPNLHNITRLIGITTYGSKRLEVQLLGDAGRRTVTRTVRLVCARRCKSTWLALHQLDTRTETERVAFLDRVEAELPAAVGR